MIGHWAILLARGWCSLPLKPYTFVRVKTDSSGTTYLPVASRMREVRRLTYLVRGLPPAAEATSLLTDAYDPARWAAQSSGRHATN